MLIKVSLQTGVIMTWLLFFLMPFYTLLYESCLCAAAILAASGSNCGGFLYADVISDESNI